jgi:hypothetical protein
LEIYITIIAKYKTLRNEGSLNFAWHILLLMAVNKAGWINNIKAFLMYLNSLMFQKKSEAKYKPLRLRAIKFWLLGPASNG